MASETTATRPTGNDESIAQKLAQQHADHHATVEDVPDEDDPPAGSQLSEKAAGKRKEETRKATPLDTRSEELFPSLGKPSAAKTAGTPGVWGGGKPSANGEATQRNGSAGSVSPSPGALPKPASAGLPYRGGAPNISIPGKNVETVTLEKGFVLPREKLRRPIPDIIKDINRRSRANIVMTPSTGGNLRFAATGAPDVAQQALKDLISQIGIKTTINVQIPQSARAHIIGKGGATIKALQEKTGAKIQLPKQEDIPAGDEDDDTLINVQVEGNALTAESARQEIQKIVNERSASVSTRLRDVPAEFYPFISGPKNSLINELEGSGVQIRVPPYKASSAQLPPRMPAKGERPVFLPASHDNHIQLAGDRASVQAARAAIERRVAELHQQLALDQFSLDRGRQQFMRGMPMDEFFENTGCTIILPIDADDEMVTVVGPSDRIQQGVDSAVDLITDIQSSSIDISRTHRNAPGGAEAHARNITRYLRHRKELERLEKQFNSHISTQYSEQGVRPWEILSRDGRSAIQARTAINGIISGHPPSRMATVPVDDFYHQHLRREFTSKLKENHGVHLVVPEASETGFPVLLVYESLPGDEPYQIPQSPPSPEEVEAFKQALNDARNAILELVSNQEEIKTITIDVPQKFHERLRRFIKNEQDKRPQDIGVRVVSTGSTVKLRGHSSAVTALAEKVKAFVEQEKEDEKERGFTMSFDFPQKFAQHLIGKGGSNIKELRERFDVDIQVQDGKVELRGPKAKAEAAKAHISSLGRTLQDETTHILKIDPKFHRELIGSGGKQINRLQDKYKVLIFFPRSAKNVKDDQSNVDAASEAGKPRRQQEPDEVVIRGPKKGADEARGEILDLLQYLKDTSHTATISMQQKQLPSLIGQGGAALEEIRQSTGAKIDIPTSRESEIVEIQLKGTKDQVAAAKKILEQKRAVFADTVVKTIDVDKKHHRALIGTNGTALRDIVVAAGGSDDRRELARTIQFPKQDSDGNAIKVEGRTDVVDKIVARIQEIVSERESQVTEVVDVPVDKHSKLIGRGGAVRKEMESKFHVAIEIPKQGDNKTGVKITGRAEAVEKAKEHILSLTKEQQGETIQVPRSLHQAISNNGQFFRNAKRDHHVTIDHAGHAVPQKQAAAGGARANGGSLPLITDDEDQAADAHSWTVVEAATAEEGEIPWVLRGSPENVEKVKQAIQAALAQAQKHTTTGYLALPDPRLFRHVIGPNGSKVKSIRSQSGCRINVPTRGQQDDDVIEVIGSRDGVEKAKELILAAVRDGQSSNGNGRSRD